MRNRFEPQLVLGQLPISETVIPLKGRDSLPSLLAALKEIFITEKYHTKVFGVLENKIFANKKKTGRKGEAVLRLKTDSFVVESNVHFPTDYNLLWDCSRKSLDMVKKFLEKYPGIQGWRKIRNWYSEKKGYMRGIGKVKPSRG